MMNCSDKCVVTVVTIVLHIGLSIRDKGLNGIENNGEI